MDIEIEAGELPGGLDQCLAVVRDGHVVTITEGGRPVARIEPIAPPSPMDRWRAERRVTPALQPKMPSPEPLAIAGTVSDLIDDQRR